jgi:predicted Zn-dependent peptidase
MPASYHLSRLPNGLRVATAEMPHMTSVCAGLWAGVGGRFEPAGLNGVSHFIEHMLFKGTRRRSARQIAEAVEGVGGTLDAFTDADHTCFYARVGHERFEEVLEVLCDMFLRSEFAPEEIEKERDVIMEEVAMYLDQPNLYVQELLNETLWPDHPLGRCLTGTEKTVRGLTREQMVSFKKQNYVAGNCLVTVAGRVRHRDVVRAVTRLTRSFPLGTPPRYLPVSDIQSGTRTRLLKRNIEQTQLELGFRVCSRHDERRFAMRLLNSMLGDNTMSRLFQTLREDHGLVYSVHSTLSLYEDVGALTISAGLEHDTLPKVLRLIMGEARRFAEAAPSSAELRRARDYVLGQQELGLESTETQMNWLGEHLLGFGNLPDPTHARRRLAQVTPAQIRAVAAECFRPDRLSLALIGPAKSDRSLRQLLGRLGR